MYIQGSGIGLRHPHLAVVLEQSPDIGWFEVHSENFFTHSIATQMLDSIAEQYPLSMHGIGLSIGSADVLSTKHLTKLKEAITRFNPEFISEHLSWSSFGSHYANDLLPLPYTEESLEVFCNNVIQVQDFLDVQILIENPSSYLQYQHSTIPEWEFLNALPERTGCGLLLDVNNVYVTSKNHNYDPIYYIDSMNGNTVREIHLAGHATKEYNNQLIYIDDHGCKVSDEVWHLYAHTLRTIGNKPTLIEWDSNIPSLSTLLAEAQKADDILALNL